MEGAVLNGSCVEASSKAPEQTRVRSCYVGFVEKTGNGVDYDTKIDLPVYLSKDKELFLKMFSCAYLGEKDDIILAGTSFYLI
jgi:hypothetical protein